MASTTDKTFWEHLDDLRALLLRSLVVVLGAAVVCFCLKDELFAVVLAPLRPDFLLYRVLAVPPPDFGAGLVNTRLSGQLMMHLKLAVGAGLCCSVPVLAWLGARYLGPALYPRERRALGGAFAAGGLLFALGVSVAYILVFPLAYRFLAGYEVSASVTNMITLDSYVDNLLTLCLVMGVLFELPVVARVLSAAGLVDRGLMRRYRRHAIVCIVTLAAVVTPTTDALTLALVSLPVWLLYEASVLVVKK